MIVLIGIALILLLLVVVPAGPPRTTRGWTGFVAGPSATDRDDARATGDLRI